MVSRIDPTEWFIALDFLAQKMINENARRSGLYAL